MQQTVPRCTNRMDESGKNIDLIKLPFPFVIVALQNGRLSKTTNQVHAQEFGLAVLFSYFSRKSQWPRSCWLLNLPSIVRLKRQTSQEQLREALAKTEPEAFGAEQTIL